MVERNGWSPPSFTSPCSTPRMTSSGSTVPRSSIIWITGLPRTSPTAKSCAFALTVFLETHSMAVDRKPASRSVERIVDSSENPPRLAYPGELVGEEHDAELAHHDVERSVLERQRRPVGDLPGHARVGD